MAASPNTDLPHELLPVVDTELAIEGLETAVDQQKLESAVMQLPGIESVRFVNDKISIRHDVEAVNEKGLREAIERTGYRVREVASDTTQPVVEPLPTEQ